MKYITILSAVMLFTVQSSQAQFLKKLKQKAEAAVSKAVDGGASAGSNDTNLPNTSTSGAGGNNGGGGASGSQAGAYSPSKFGNVAFTLQPDERIVYGEHTLSIVNNQTVVKVVTRQNKQYYLYENDKRTGPFPAPPVQQLGNWRSYDMYDDNEKKSTDWQPYIVRGVLTVDGKAYGSYMSMASFYHNKATKKFYGVGVKLEANGAGFYLVSNSGERKLPFMATELLVSDNDQVGGALIPATQYNAKTPEETVKYVTNDDMYIVLADGTAKGPFPAVQANQSYLDNSGNFIQVSDSRKAVFVNGKQTITLSPNMSGNGKFFIGNEGKSGAWFERGSLFFTDGTSIVDYALQPAVSTVNGKATLNWLSIQNNQVYVCHKEL